MGDFAKTSWGWQRQQLWQRLGEGWEFFWRREPSPQPEAPAVSVPGWLTSPLWEELARWLTWGLLGAIALWGTWRLWQAWQPYRVAGRPRRGRRSRTGSASGTPSRSPGRWLAAAQAYQGQGDYRRACFCLYEGALQHLNDRQLVPQLASRTDGEYARAVAALPNSAPYQTLLRQHEALCYGEAEATPERYAACREAFQQL